MKKLNSKDENNFYIDINKDIFASHDIPASNWFINVLKKLEITFFTIVIFLSWLYIVTKLFIH